MPRRPKIPALVVSALVALAAVWLLRPASKPQANESTDSFAPKSDPAVVPAVASIRPAPRPGPAPALVAAADFVSVGEAAKTPSSFPATTALLAWSERYLAASVAARPSLISEGLELARERRPLLAELIRKDPESALAAAVPRAVRDQLPAEVVAELEQLVSARAELAVIQTCLHPPGAAHDPADDLYRATVINDREYRAHVYGSRLGDGSLPETSIIGIAVDRDLAVSDSRLRVLDAAELASNNIADGVAVEANGTITVLPSPEAVAPFAARLVATEQNAALDLADSGPGSSGVGGRPTQAWTHGTKDLLVIRVDFSDLTGTPINKFDGNAQITPGYVDTVINGANGVRSFLQQSSFGKTDILFNVATDVTGVLRVPNTASSYALAGDSTLLHSHARSAAASAGFDVSNYERVAVVFTYLGDIASSKITYGGLANLIGTNLWVNGEFDLRVVGHELGHTYGLPHANLWKVTDGNPVSLAGSSTEYGDPFDLMGDGDFFQNDFSHWNKSLLQWIPDTAVTVASTAGTYRIHRFDSASADLGSPRALKVVRDSTRDYWIGYRRGTSSGTADNGAYVLWGYNTASEGDLLDLVTPGTDANNAPLPLNTTFNDSAAGITLRPVAQGGSGADEWIDVQVGFQPRIQWVATSYVANEQSGSVVLTATRSANSAGAVSASYSTASGTATSGADFTASSGSLSWADGDLSPKTVTIPLTADAIVEGTETFTVTLSSPVGGVVVAPATVTVTVADPGARDPAFASDFIGSTVNRVLPLPDGKVLIAGWFSQLQSISDFTVYNYGRIARLTATGTIDTTFNPGGGANGVIHAIARQPDGKILIGGDFSSFNGTPANRVARLNSDGSLDTTFTAGSGPNGVVYALLLQPDGKIIIGGGFTGYAATPREYLARLNGNGSLDSGFTGPDFASTSGWRVKALTLQPDGKILVGGVFYFSGSPFRASLCRLSASGAIDATFTGVTQGAHLAGSTSDLRTVEDIVVQPDGGILVSGDFTAFNNTPRYRIARLTFSGLLDNTFAPVLDGAVYALLLLPDGRILLGGDFTTINGTSAGRLARLQSTGALDTAFAAAGGHASTVEDLALQPDGNVLLAGDYASFQGASPEGPLWRFVPGLSGLPGVLQFASDAASGVEGASATLTVTRSGGSLGALTVGYATVAGTAAAGADFTAASGSLSWADGDNSAKTITVSLASDALADTPESLVVNLGAPQIGGALLADRQQATITIRTAFTAWLASHFSSAEQANPAVSGDDADPDGDGFTNLAEFALGLGPRRPDTAPAWNTAVQNIGGTDYLTLTFKRRAPALDLAYTVQSSGDLATWSTGPVQVGSAAANGDGTETVTYRDNVAVGGGGRRFLRVHVTRTP